MKTREIRNVHRLWTVIAALGLGLFLAAGLSQAQEPEAPAGVAAPQFALGTAFTYQGRLVASGEPASGLYDFTFTLYDTAEGDHVVGGPLNLYERPVSGGLFDEQLDFGGGAFNGEARWLEVKVRPSAGGPYTTLEPRQALTPSPYALALPGMRTEETDFSANVIGGYCGNRAEDGVVAATIGGGGTAHEACGTSLTEPCANYVLDDYGTVGGGYFNQAGNGLGTLIDAGFATVSGGTSNHASGNISTVGGGSSNRAGGNLSTVSGGHNNEALNEYATVAGGIYNRANGLLATVGGGSSNDASNDNATASGGGGNTASGQYSTIPGGFEARATHYGEMAYASGSFGGWLEGDAQASLYVLRNMTTNATQTELFLDRISERITLVAGRALSFEAMVVGTSDAGETAGYRIWGVIENFGGATSMIGASGLVFGEDDTAWGAVGAADDGHDALVFRVTGNTGDTVRWVAVVHTVEVAW